MLPYWLESVGALFTYGFEVTMKNFIINILMWSALLCCYAVPYFMYIEISEIQRIIQ